MMQKIVTVSAILLVLSAGLMNRFWTHEAENDSAVVDAAAKIQRVPMILGSWRGQTLELDPADMRKARYAAALWRRYENAETGSVVSVLLVCGRPGPVAAHTPDICYAGAGYETIEQPAPFLFDVPPGSKRRLLACTLCPAGQPRRGSVAHLLVVELRPRLASTQQPTLGMCVRSGPLQALPGLRNQSSRRSVAKRRVC